METSKENKPLTWEEIQASIGKPIYVTPWNGWVLVARDGIVFAHDHMRTWDDIYSGHWLGRWQAYRTEV